MTDNVVSWNDIASDVYAGSFIVNVSDGTVTLSQSVELEVVQFVDCAGINNGGAIEDCAGTCEGDAFTNLCGDCVTEDDTSCVQDCAGVWGGTSN